MRAGKRNHSENLQKSKGNCQNWNTRITGGNEINILTKDLAENTMKKTKSTALDTTLSFCTEGKKAYE